MSYIVKNCPSCIISPSCCAKYQIDNGHAKDCQDIEDCVIKQMIEKCKEVGTIENVKTLYDAAQSGMFLQANRILKLFDIEEINK